MNLEQIHTISLAELRQAAENADRLGTQPIGRDDRSSPAMLKGIATTTEKEIADGRDTLSLSAVEVAKIDGALALLSGNHREAGISSFLSTLEGEALDAALAVKVKVDFLGEMTLQQARERAVIANVQHSMTPLQSVASLERAGITKPAEIAVRLGLVPSTVKTLKSKLNGLSPSVLEGVLSDWLSDNSACELMNGVKTAKKQQVPAPTIGAALKAALAVAQSGKKHADVIATFTKGIEGKAKAPPVSPVRVLSAGYTDKQRAEFDALATSEEQDAWIAAHPLSEPEPEPEPQPEPETQSQPEPESQSGPYIVTGAGEREERLVSAAGALCLETPESMVGDFVSLFARVFGESVTREQFGDLLVDELASIGETAEHNGWGVLRQFPRD